MEGLEWTLTAHPLAHTYWRSSISSFFFYWPLRVCESSFPENLAGVDIFSGYRRQHHG